MSTESPTIRAMNKIESTTTRIWKDSMKTLHELSRLRRRSLVFVLDDALRQALAREQRYHKVKERGDE